MKLLIWLKKEWCDDMDKDLYVMVLADVIRRWEKLGLTGKQKNQLEDILEKIKG